MSLIDTKGAKEIIYLRHHLIVCWFGFLFISGISWLKKKILILIVSLLSMAWPSSLTASCGLSPNLELLILFKEVSLMGDEWE